MSNFLEFAKLLFCFVASDHRLRQNKGNGKYPNHASGSNPADQHEDEDEPISGCVSSCVFWNMLVQCNFENLQTIEAVCFFEREEPCFNIIVIPCLVSALAQNGRKTVINVRQKLPKFCSTIKLR